MDPGVYQSEPAFLSRNNKEGHGGQYSATHGQAEAHFVQKNAVNVFS
jgi:hypothetical protein